ncbi:Nitrilase, partial [Kickxella alabastrina]
MMASDADAHAANSSLTALSQVITSSVNQLTDEMNEMGDMGEMNDMGEMGEIGDMGEDKQDLPQDHHQEGEEIRVDDPEAHSAEISTPTRYKAISGTHRTPAKRPLSSHSGDGGSSRLKSKVWGWYEIMPDGYRQCKFCAQKYGRLTATTILARHYHNRHDPNPEFATSTPTASHRGMSHMGSASQPVSSMAAGQHHDLHHHHHHHHQQQQQQQLNMSQAAAAAAAAVAAAVANGTAGTTGETPDPQTSHLFHAASNGAVSAAYSHQGSLANGSTEDILRSVSEAVNQAPYEDSHIMMPDGFPPMLSPLARINLTPARKAIAAVAQFCAQSDVQKNLQTCIGLISTAARRGARMVFLPESSDFIAETRTQPAQNAQPLDGSFMKEIQQAAKDNAIWVSLGIHEQPALNGMPYNTNAV